MNLEVLRRGLAAVGYFLVFDNLPLIEGGKTGSLDRGNVDEHVLTTTALRLDETVALGRVEPFHCTLSHLAISDRKRGLPRSASYRQSIGMPDDEDYIAARSANR